MLPERLVVSPCKVPAVIVVPPLYVFAPLRMSVPPPSFVSDPVVEPITALIVVPPDPPTVSGCPAPVMPPVAIVSVPASELIRAPPTPSVIAPVQVLAPLILRSAPPTPTPVPFSVIASPIESPVPSICTAAPPATVVAPATVPSAELFWRSTTPALTAVAPV